jgi:DNA-binding transcriptional MerR regulator/methylmalonyl-CoA mutase cobalamin-binding subunit
MADKRTDSAAKRHPIQVVVRRTGLTADVLRAWEKRYGVVEPGRSRGGRRLYSDEDIERLRLLRRASGAGRRISQIAGLATEELAALVKEDEREEAVVAVGPGLETVQAAEVHVRDALAAVVGLDARALEVVLSRAMVRLSACAFIDRVAAPVMRRVGELWRHGDISPAGEHLASAVLLRVVGRVIEAAEPSGSALNLVVATPAHQLHEFGALFAAATAAAEGWRVTYLGRDLPASDIAAAARETSADAVALSIVHAADTAIVENELRELRKQLAVNAPLLVGGAAVPSLKEVLDEIDAVRLSSMEELRSMLAQLS